MRVTDSQRSEMNSNEAMKEAKKKVKVINVISILLQAALTTFLYASLGWKGIVISGLVACLVAVETRLVSTEDIISMIEAEDNGRE